MSVRLPPFDGPLAIMEDDTLQDEEARSYWDEGDTERPRLTLQMVESLEGPASNRAEAAWAQEVAEQVAALWEGRAGASFEQAVTAARQQPEKRRR